MTDDFLRGLASSLDAVGVRGSAARRVLLEARDHLKEAARDGEEDPARQFGDPQQVARLVAAELATGGTRRATFTSFGALALTGLGYVAVFALVPAAGGWTDLFGGRVAGAAPVLALGVALLPQIAFVAGTLALLRAFRMDRTPEAGAAELRLLRHQNWVALGGIVVNVGLNVLLIPKYLAMGSAIASLVTQLTTGLLQVYICYRVFGFKVNRRLLIALFLFIAGLFFINYFTLHLTDRWMLNFVIMLTFSGLLAFAMTASLRVLPFSSCRATRRRRAQQDS